MSGCSTLMSFGFCSEEVVAEKVYYLFSPYTNTNVGGEPVLNYFFEVYMSAYEGRVNFETFNLIGYIREIQKNNSIKAYEKAKKVKNIKFGVSEDAENEDGVSEGRIVDTRDDYEKLIDNYEVRWAIKRLKTIRKDMLVGFNVNIVATIEKALSGYPQAVETLSTLCDEIDEISKILHILLESGENVSELLALVS